jgi:hypothetical protein
MFGGAADRWINGKINLEPTTRARYAAALEVHVCPRWGAITLDRTASLRITRARRLGSSDGQH